MAQPRTETCVNRCNLWIEAWVFIRAIGATRGQERESEVIGMPLSWSPCPASRLVLGVPCVAFSAGRWQPIATLRHRRSWTRLPPQRRTKRVRLGVPVFPAWFRLPRG